ncbi:shikimate dehydrogenase [Bosea sp. (in: a-proteobacteria)]|uniref:shikimate dehydrogenase n=1 Tax=Bosea sp. (in: a-proteobacteria) TaxID=1871050 RepID=UPI00260AF147|nr:shikimate dehydrogenase [Bosea sp. (in: a-proteobacteria)]MCO5090502.1 shikimate dehydrogenase [Bosea sp. (in: a-proteobacteria)]
MAPRCFVIGHPIAHSRSPLIHGEWLRAHRLAGSYERIDVAPADLPAFIGRLREGEFAGGNVTVPHKEAVMALVDGISEAGRAVGAVNTLWRENGRIVADNTDVSGFLAHLDATVPGWQGRVGTALVLGAGGAARGICYGLKSRGVARILVANRSRGRAEELAAALGHPLEAADWAGRHALVGEADLIVNTTALGMQGKPPLEIDLSALRPGTIVDDIVYVPLKTALLTEAARRGGIPVDGLGMLLHQAAPGFARWFGVMPAVTPALRALIEADILKA